MKMCRLQTLPVHPLKNLFPVAGCGCSQGWLAQAHTWQGTVEVSRSLPGAAHVVCALLRRLWLREAPPPAPPGPAPGDWAMLRGSALINEAFIITMATGGGQRGKDSQL